MNKRFWLPIALLAIFAMVLAACQPAAETAPVEEAAPAEEEAVVVEDPCMGAKPGDEITLLYQWSGTEEEKLNAILAPFVEQCGIVLKPESTRDQALLDTKVQAGTPQMLHSGMSLNSSSTKTFSSPWIPWEQLVITMPISSRIPERSMAYGLVCL
jgi:hypothetical protein